MPPARLEARMDSLLSFPVGLFHPLQHAGLSRRTPVYRLIGTWQQAPRCQCRSRCPYFGEIPRCRHFNPLRFPRQLVSRRTKQVCPKLAKSLKTNSWRGSDKGRVPIAE